MKNDNWDHPPHEDNDDTMASDAVESDALEDDPDDDEGVYIPPYLFSSQVIDPPSRRRVRVLREQGRRVLTVDGVVQRYVCELMAKNLTEI